jgi:hypothetical protein
MERFETEWKKYPVIRLDISRIKDLDDEIFTANMDSILGVIEKKIWNKARPQQSCLGRSPD